MIALRVVAAVLALLWAVPLFGVIDLSLLVFENPWFMPVAPLEVSWGSLFTYFLAVPMAVVVVWPSGLWGALAVNAVAVVALLAGAGLSLHWPAAVLALVVAVASLPLLPLGRRALRQGRLAPPAVRAEAHWPLLALSVLGLALWAPYTAHAVAAFGVLEDDITNGVSHWPVQVAAGSALMLGALTAALLPEPRRLAVVAVALSAVSIGVSAAAKPRVPAATETEQWGVLCVLWGVLFALVAPLPGVAREKGAA